MFIAYTTGFVTGFALILAIGAQNAFVIRQGLAKTHVFWLCLFCAVSDAILVSVGVLGFGAIVERMPMLPLIMTLAGAAFLMSYSLLRFRAAWIGDYDVELGGRSKTLSMTIATAAAFTWLNPHVYLDTVGLIGAISTKFATPLHYLYGAGAITASFVFFFGLGYGARLLAPIMTSAKAWRVLDIIIGVVMLALAAKLLFI